MVFKFLMKYWVAALVAPVFMFLEVMMDLRLPMMMAQIIDQGVRGLDMQVVWQTGLLMLGYTGLSVIGGLGGTIFSSIASQNMGADLRLAAFSKVQSFSFGNLDKFQTGHLVTRLTNDVTQVQMMVLMSLRMVVRAPIMLIGSIIYATRTIPELAWLLAVSGGVIIVVIIFFTTRAFPIFKKVQKQVDRLNSVLQENLAGIRLVKTFARADYEKKRFSVENNDMMALSIKAGKLMALVFPIMMFIINFGTIGVLYYGGIAIPTGATEIGSIIAFTQYMAIMLFSMMMVAFMMVFIARGQASVQRINEVLNEEPEIKNSDKAIVEFTSKGKIQFDNVTFSYSGSHADPVLKNISFTANPGETVAILGATGSGKTSLINLIPRFYEVTDGAILIDDVNIKDLDKKTLRSNIGMVLQESILFSGTVKDNIGYGIYETELDDEEAEVIAKASQAWEFISETEKGLDSRVGQRGVNLSGGQKQRVSIARALAKKPPIVIFDDSTSAVDVQTEVKIHDAMEELMADTTVFMVAQRISTVLNADKILVLEDGQIVGEGTHEELIINNAVYRDIYRSQLGEEEAI